MSPEEIIPAVLDGDKLNPVATLINKMNNFADGVPSDGATWSEIVLRLKQLDRENRNFTMAIGNPAPLMTFEIAPATMQHTRDRMGGTFMCWHRRIVLGTIDNHRADGIGLQCLVRDAKALIKDYNARGLCPCNEHFRLPSAEYCSECCLRRAIREDNPNIQSWNKTIG